MHGDVMNGWDERDGGGFVSLLRPIVYSLAEHTRL